MKKLLALLFIFVLVFSLFACNKKNDAPIINDEPMGDIDDTEGGIDDNSASEMYFNKTYSVGNDLPEGFYVINCTKSNYGMDVVVFTNESDYKAFESAEKYTNGEYKRAKELHGWASFYLKENEVAYVGLEKGNIILLDNGMCEFNRHNAQSSKIIYPGIYVVGKDIEAESLNITCMTHSMQVTVFESVDKYVKYHQSDRYTYGEEADAIEQHSLSDDYFYNGKGISVDLTEGMVLMVGDGNGEYTIDNGPVIN